MKKIVTIGMIFVLLATAIVLSGCTEKPPVSSSGINVATVQLQTGSDGYTAEQRNIAARLKEDNRPGAVKHLYVISAYSGQVIIYSTVDGKVTSSGKRLTPYTITGPGQYQYDAFDINIGGVGHKTAEVLQDDGTYGSSIPYLYWWDTKGVFHKHYASGGEIIHISNQPLAVKGIIINMEISGLESESVEEVEE